MAFQYKWELISEKEWKKIKESNNVIDKKKSIIWNYYWWIWDDLQLYEWKALTENINWKVKLIAESKNINNSFKWELEIDFRKIKRIYD